MGQVVAHLGDSLQAELSSCLPIFLERLRNEITRLTAVKALPEVLKLAESPLLQGAALAAMLDFFRALVGAGVPGLSHSDMLALLVNPILTPKGAAIHKQGRANIAKCAASLVSHSQAEAVIVVKQFMQQLNTPGLPDYSMTFSLLAIGETGRGADLSQVSLFKHFPICSNS